jgi:ferredoxin
MPMRIWIDRDACVGSGQCVMTAPELFDQDDDGIAFLAREDLAQGSVAVLRSVEHACPSRAIHLEEAD